MAAVAARAAASSIRRTPWKKGRDACRWHASLPIRSGRWRVARSATRGGLPANSVLQPGEGHQEQRRQDEAQQRVDPHEGDVKAHETEAGPEDAEGTVCFQERRSVAVIESGRDACKIA